MHNVLIIGSGGREHAIAWKLKQSDELGELYIAPGNPGTARLGINVDLDSSDFGSIVRFAKEKEIGLVVIGPEKPLVDGLADLLEEEGIPVFGPRKDAARLEGSKQFAKEFMTKYEIPTAGFRVFEAGEREAAAHWIRERGVYPVVLKADGLAGGKGVFICESQEEAEERLELIYGDDTLKEAASRLVIEEFMEGEEASVFAITDGYTARVLHNAQDHKRIGDGDTGLNTGGMGAYCPAPVMTPEMMERVEREIIEPTITGMQLEGSPYQGILYVGLMITGEGPKVVEYNCRFGDPECQAILPSLKNDLLSLMLACLDQRLDEKEIQLDDLYRCCVVMASGGYPSAFEKGKVITGLDRIDEDAFVFHAGTAEREGEIVTAGGRVLNVVGSGGRLEDAIEHAYRNVRRISFEGAYYRSDIGAKGILHGS